MQLRNYRKNVTSTYTFCFVLCDFCGYIPINQSINQSIKQLADVGSIPVLQCVSYIELIPALKVIS